MMQVKNIYLVKDLARLSEASSYTVKYYLKLGLIREMGRSPATNFRYFDDSTLLDLKKIIGWRREGVSLDRIKHLLNTGTGA
jgi:DNA-binding transcriptional MerR regulator